ncbi:MAG TPA: ABC transporter permease [Smithellaceae bacterium]|jgi:peptide/nickel transport system permease protein|nr:ABC transporter permease [Syntrophaceae bacterium]NMC92846.1 ABC transporter permease [Smithella sp.]HNV56744.1 ABC transporter permease [Smithellaceae bacterium]MBP8665636.1 ABC transporter permease [Syntrophaceae bacterium]MBP9531236.1 ABC transporter permease [Syntrophaceae bacterium]
MFSYLVKRVLFMIPLLLGITIICFFVMRLAPGSPTDLQTQMNPKASAEMRQRLMSLYELDKPVYVQYASWLTKLARGDLGTSFSSDHRPVADKILERLPITIAINLLSLIIIIAVAVPIGVLSAVHQDSLFDKVMSVIVFIGFAAPTFWLALLLMIFFGIHLGWLPISGLRSLNYEYLSAWEQLVDLAAHLVLPVFISAFGGLAGLSRYMRANMLEVIRQDYILTARAKGLSERQVIYKHALRNALLPAITILGLSIPGLIGGSVIFETIFAIPGMGQLFYMSVMARDYPTVMGILLIGAVLTLVGNLIADVSYAAADPRIRIS